MHTSTPRGAKGETTANDAAYTAYLCTAAAAETYFGGNTGYESITTYQAGNYATGMAALKAGDNMTAMSLDDFDLGVYSFYAPFKQSGEGTMAFKLTTEGGTAGAWTAAAAVPEPRAGCCCSSASQGWRSVAGGRKGALNLAPWNLRLATLD